MLQESNDSKTQRQGINLSGQEKKKKEIEMTKIEWSLIAAGCSAWLWSTLC